MQISGKQFIYHNESERFQLILQKLVDIEYYWDQDKNLTYWTYPKHKSAQYAHYKSPLTNNLDVENTKQYTTSFKKIKEDQILPLKPLIK